mmetsp:Transcript_6678/g.16148  ORF Transcript_6678/g.16148 Transcript_6678/m.16148 type:complete len:361 (-) Transcript_6678:144-1226(-)
MLTAKTPSRPSPISARSDTCRRRSKFVLAPEVTAMYVGGGGGESSARRRAASAPSAPTASMAATLFSTSSGPVSAPPRATNAFSPATPSAPAGSKMARVSSKTSLMAAQISSLLTTITPSTKSLHSRNVSAPTSVTAVPSANVPTLGSSTRSPAARLRAMASASSLSTPYTFTSGRSRFSTAAMPAISPPPPTGTNTASTSSHCRKISNPTVPCPAITAGWSNGGTNTFPVASATRSASFFAASKLSPCSTTRTPRRRPTASTLIRGVASGMTMVASTPRRSAARATPCAWLPADAATHPAARSAAAYCGCAIILYAPRSLKEKTSGWASSRLRRTRGVGVPSRAARSGAGSRGDSTATS